MTKDDILKLDSKKHVKIWLLNKLGMSRKEIAEALGTNAGHVGNEIKSYLANKEKREAAESLFKGEIPKTTPVKKEEPKKAEVKVDDKKESKNYDVVVEESNWHYDYDKKQPYWVSKKHSIAHEFKSKKEALDWISKNKKENSTIHKFSYEVVDRIGDLHLFNETSKFIYYLSPGPAKIKGNLENSISVLRKMDGDKVEYKFKNYTDDQIKKQQSKTKEDYKNVVWIDFGGYCFGIMYVYEIKTTWLLGRPNNAVGNAVLFSKIPNSTKKDFESILKKYSNISDIRKFLLTFEGKPAVYVSHDVLMGKQKAEEGALIKGAIAQGPSHANGGIKTITPNGPLEIEGGEIVINKEASAKHCQELSKINQSAGGGVAFPCDHKGTDGDKAKLGAEIGDPSNIKFMRWFVGFYKSIDQKMNIQIVLPIKPKDADEWWFPESAETNAVILEVFEKKTWMDAKPFLRTITGKADELGVSIYLEPTPRHQRLNEEQKKKITKEYLTNYYSKFGFKPYKDGYMVRTPNKTASDGAKIPNTSLKQGIEIEKEHTDLYDELSLRLEAEGSKMPMTQDEFFEWIAKAHIKEVPDYYELLKKYIEPTTYTTQELNSWWYGLDSDTQQYLFEDGERDSSWSDRDSDGVWEGLTDRRKAQIMEAMLNPENTAITVKYGLNLVGFDRYGNGIAKHGAKIDDSLLVNDRGYYYRLKESNDGNFTIAELGINGKEKGTLNIPYSFSEQNIYRKANEEEVEDFNKTTEKAKHGTEVEEEEERLEEGDRIIVEYGNQFYGRKGTVEEVRRGFVIVSIDDDEDDDLYSMHSSDVKKIDDDEDDDDSDHDLYAKAGMKIRTKVGPRYDVVYTDRDYKTHTKSFYNDPLGPPENGLEKAKKYEKKLNDEDAKSQYGLYRSVTIKIEHESEASKKPYFLLNKDEVIHERDRLEALPEIKGADYTRLMDIARYSVTKFNTLLSKL